MSHTLASIANLIGESGEMAKQPLPQFISDSWRSPVSSRQLPVRTRQSFHSFCTFLKIVITGEARDLLFCL
jgi:hypothetical protein